MTTRLTIAASLVGLALGVSHPTHREPPEPEVLRYHVIARGESLWTIGTRYGCRTDAAHIRFARRVREANGWRTAPLLQPGMGILVPVGGDR